MSQAPPSTGDDSAAPAIGPLRDSFLRHLAAENRSRSTLTSYGAAIDLLSAFLGDHLGPTAGTQGLATADLLGAVPARSAHPVYLGSPEVARGSEFIA
jgi:hypothetical protein